MINDFYEILGRGIIATRSRRSAEAIKYLELAAKIEPANPRVWLWLAAAEESIPQKRQYLEQALKVDPNILVAKVLLQRLNQERTAISQRASDFVIFHCPYCGGKQRFEPDISGMRCEYCKKVERLMLKNASNEQASLDAALKGNSGNWAVLEGQATCGACGAAISISPNLATLNCPFCDSDLITIQSATPDLIAPTAIAPFQYHTDDVIEIIGECWGIPPPKLDFLLGRHEVTISSIYLPFWSFDGRVQIRCALGYRVAPGVYSPSERVILKGEWPMEKSWFEIDVDDLPVYAAHTLTEDAVGKILPFDQKSVFEYCPEMLVGWQAEYYQIALEDAEVVAQKRMRDVAFSKAARRGLFMEPSRMLRDDVLVIDRTYKLILLPVCIVRRKMSGKIQRILINGQTGKVSDKQTNWLDFLKRWP